MHTHKPVVTTPWLAIWSLGLAWSWLLPNHYNPWLSFHSDAWLAIMLTVAAATVLWRPRDNVRWHPISVFCGLLCLIPAVQSLTGLIQLPGNAWISSAYLMGLVLAILIGARWEASAPGQLGDGLFLAIGLAAVGSVVMQCLQGFDLLGSGSVFQEATRTSQSLKLDGLGLWVNESAPSRPSANLGQPNQLATLLLWGVLAMAWGMVRQRVSAWFALPMLGVLLFGIALTSSRTAWIGVLFLVIASWLWRHLWKTRKWSWVASGFGVYFVLCVVWWHYFQVDQQPLDVDAVLRLTTETRPAAWSMFLDAIWDKPWFGYGWNQTALAHVAVANAHPALHVVFAYSHNLFLDLLIWCGLPLGGFIAITLLWWLGRCVLSVACAEDALLALALLIVGNHAFFEYPLTYAYFLLPAGLFIGILSHRLQSSVLFTTPRLVLWGLWLTSSMVLALIIRDYIRVEPSVQTLRHEWTNIKVAVPAQPPDVVLLTQWHEYIESAQVKPDSGMPDQEIKQMRAVTSLYPNGILVFQLALTLGLNGQTQEARDWLTRLCKISSEDTCLNAEKIWSAKGRQHPEIATIPWPVDTSAMKARQNKAVAAELQLVK